MINQRQRKVEGVEEEGEGMMVRLILVMKMILAENVEMAMLMIEVGKGTEEAERRTRKARGKENREGRRLRPKN